MDTKWLTYEELGEALGIAPASAKRLAIRRRWAKKPGNDGRTRVEVPVERLVAKKVTLPVTSDATSDIASDAGSDIASDSLAVVTVLTRHIERLEGDLAALTGKLADVEADRSVLQDRTLELAAQNAAIEPLKVTVEALKSALESERSRGYDLRAERDRALERAALSQKAGMFARLRRAFG